MFSRKISKAWSIWWCNWTRFEAWLHISAYSLTQLVTWQSHDHACPCPLHGQVGRDTHLITSPDRRGLPDFFAYVEKRRKVWIWGYLLRASELYLKINSEGLTYIFWGRIPPFPPPPPLFRCFLPLWPWWPLFFVKSCKRMVWQVIDITYNLV